MDMVTCLCLNQSLYSDMAFWPAGVTCATWSLWHREAACDLPYHPPLGNGENS